MQAEILDTRVEGSTMCYLIKASLFDYINSLPENYQEYKIQRGIVSNIYLDSLINTVLKGSHIPPIVLTVSSTKENPPQCGTVNIAAFRILDGLQRTYRLHMIWKTIMLAKEQLSASRDILELNRYQMSKRYSKELTNINSSTKILFDIVQDFKQKRPSGDIEQSFKDNYQWFEVWYNLSPDEEVNKMLILNAGHKPVKIKHQLELIFLNILPVFENINIGRFHLVRERETSSIHYGKERSRGEFLFSHLISALLSFRVGQPVTTNSTLILKSQNEDFATEIDSKLLSYEFLVRYINSVLEIESSLLANYDIEGIKWIGREVVLSGIYGAIGKSIGIHNIHIENIDSAFEGAVDLLLTNIRRLNIHEFETERNSLDLAKVNIGTANKNAVFRGVLHVLSSRNSGGISWVEFFKGSTNE
ncbi:hypothetical protein GCM10028824_43570 [Hymenobacter segetis]|uniref:DUF262 domain-containing protein n=1 Tax=Hymenobacter segetis TaxID=2025509 RepID=A0ABU9LUY7_9BACT